MRPSFSAHRVWHEALVLAIGFTCAALPVAALAQTPAGVIDTIQKPYDFNDLLVKIRSAIGPFDRDDGICPGRHGSAGHDPDRGAGRQGEQLLEALSEVQSLAETLRHPTIPSTR